MIVDRTFAMPNENYQKRLDESKQCMVYLEKWLKKFKGKPENPHFQIFNQGGGLQEPYRSCSKDLLWENQRGACTQIFTQLNMNIVCQMISGL